MEGSIVDVYLGAQPFTVRVFRLEHSVLEDSLTRDIMEENSL